MGSASEKQKPLKEHEVLSEALDQHLLETLFHKLLQKVRDDEFFQVAITIRNGIILTLSHNDILVK